MRRWAVVLIALVAALAGQPLVDGALLTGDYSYDGGGTLALQDAWSLTAGRPSASAVEAPLAWSAARRTAPPHVVLARAESGVATNTSIKTPYGVAQQADDAASAALRSKTGAGGTVYRQGNLGVQETTTGQFWAGENPLTNSAYANAYGTPGSAAPDWVMGGTVRPGSPFVTRPAPGIGTNLGGAPEVVVNAGDVIDSWFYMP